MNPATTNERDRRGWLECWGELGVRGDDGQVVAVTVGLLPPENDPVIGVRVGDDAAPVLLTLNGAKNLRQAFDTALDERRISQHQSDRARREAAKNIVGDAILTRQEWDAIRHGLADDDAEARERARTVLEHAAPSAWTEKGGDR